MHYQTNRAIKIFFDPPMSELKMLKVFLKFFLKRYEDEDLQQILMQLVHLMKFEPYPDVAFAAREDHFHNIPNLSISRILVKRAIKTRAFGHFLLWNLRGEQERIAGSSTESCPLSQLYRFRCTILMDSYLQ